MIRLTAIFLVLTYSYGSFAIDQKKLPRVLLNLFSAHCSSVGGSTRNALNVADGLVDSFESLIDDPQCSQASGAIDSLNTFRTHLNAMSHTTSEYRILELERTIENYTLALNSITDPALLSQIISALTNARLQLISTKSFRDADNFDRGRERRLDGYYLAASSLGQFFDELPYIQSCSNKWLKLSQSIFSDAMNIGSFFVNPGMASAMSGIAGVVNSALDSLYQIIKKARFRKLKEVSLPTALSCSAEALTDFYCEAIRAEKIVRTYAQYEEDNNVIWQGVPFIFRKLNPLLEWLELVRGGSPASDSFDAQRRIEILKLESFLEELKQRINGFISDTDREIKTLSDINLNNYLFSKINGITNLLRGSKAVITLNGLDFLPFRVIGLTGIPKCSFQGNLDNCTSLAQFKTFYNNGPGNPGYSFTLNDWERAKIKYIEIYREAVNFINQQLARIVNEDQESVLTAAFEGYPEERSPFNTLNALNDYAQSVKNYLIGNNVNKKYNPYLLSIESTQLLLTEVYDLLENWRVNPPPERDANTLNDKAGKILGTIYDKFQLKTGNRYLVDRIRSMLKWDIIVRMENGEFTDELREIIVLNNNNVISDITAYKLFNFQDMVNDLANSKGLLKATLRTFFKEMNRYYLRSLEMVDEYDLDPSLRDKICVHLLSSPLINSSRKGKKYLKYCRGLTLNSVFRNSGLSIRINDHVDALGNFITSFDDRVCLYNDFMRESRIREQFRNELD